MSAAAERTPSNGPSQDRSSGGAPRTENAGVVADGIRSQPQTQSAWQPRG